MEAVLSQKHEIPRTGALVFMSCGVSIENPGSLEKKPTVGQIRRHCATTTYELLSPSPPLYVYVRIYIYIPVCVCMYLFMSCNLNDMQYWF